MRKRCVLRNAVFSHKFAREKISGAWIVAGRTGSGLSTYGQPYMEPGEGDKPAHAIMFGKPSWGMSHGVLRGEM